MYIKIKGIILSILWGIFFIATDMSIKIIENIKYKIDSSTIKKYIDMIHVISDSRTQIIKTRPNTKINNLFYNVNELCEIHRELLEMELFSILHQGPIKKKMFEEKQQLSIGYYDNRLVDSYINMPLIPSIEKEDIVEEYIQMFSHQDTILQSVYNLLYEEMINPTSFNPIHGFYSKIRNKITFIKREFERRKVEVEYDYADIKTEITEGIYEIWRAYTFFFIYFSFLLYNIRKTTYFILENDEYMPYYG